MEKRQFYDIADVCRMLGITSRTLRFYEEKGIIRSTTVGLSSRRQYTEEQLSHIRNVLVLRTLGISVKAISELQAEKTDLKEAILSRRAEIYASINSRIKEIYLLNDALLVLETGESIFEKEKETDPTINSKEYHIARLCTESILTNDDEGLYQYVGDRLKKYMPREVYRYVRKDTFASLGDLISIEEVAFDRENSHKLYSKVRFSKIGLLITFVFYKEKIEGLWLGYYETTQNNLG